MFKRYLKLLSVFFLAVVLVTGCSQSSSSSTDPDTEESSDTTTDDSSEDESSGDDSNDTSSDESDTNTSSDESSNTSDVSSFNIIGKWKSVGKEGFGQAQPGSVIVFNGQNCNFYSPKDTYGITKEGDTITLDITSLLGESKSFKVIVTDDDNIQIKGEGSTTTLKRVE